MVEGKQGVGETAYDLAKGTLTTLVPIPGSGNVIRFVDYWRSFEEGEEGSTFNPYQALTEGKNRND
jgi:hypothetical protein